MPSMSAARPLDRSGSDRSSPHTSNASRPV
jgi:hypothetical protein